MKTAISKAIEVLGGTQVKAADALDISQAHLSDLANGKYKITPELAVKTEIATKGAVTRADLRPEIFGKLNYNEAEAA